MATRTNDTRSPRKARVVTRLELRRKQIALSQADVADDVYERTGEELGQQAISNWENGKTDLRNVHPTKLYAYAAALRIAPHELEQYAGVAPGSLFPAAVPELRTYQPRTLIPFLGAVSGGAQVTSVEMRAIPDEIAAPYEGTQLRALDVTPDTLVCPGVRSEIPQNATVVVHVSLQPQPGSVVLEWLENEHIAVLRHWHPRSGAYSQILEAYNGRRRPLIMDERTPSTVQGVVVGLWVAMRPMR